MKTEKLIIIGSGPAAHTAALYAARATLSPLLYEGLMAGGVAAGGQLTTTTEVENFPGFPEGISGPKLMEKMRAQSLRYGTRIETKTVTRVDLSQTPFRLWVGETEAAAHALLLATGATAKRLGVEGEAAFWQRGISACAVCDGPLPLFRNQPLAVIGGGDTACEEALFLTKYASQVFLIHRRNQLRASKIMQDRVFNNKKITLLWNYKLEKVEGGDTLTQVRLSQVKYHTTKTLPVGGLFYAIGHAPNSEFLKGQVALDPAGYVLTEPGSTKTSRAGVFAAGDVQDKKYRQAITAAGSGCIAFMECQEYLSGLRLA